MIAAVALAACAPMACKPSTIVVVKKEQRAGPETPPGIRITETGRIEEPMMVIERDYWVQAEDGSWHPVTARQYDSVEVGGRLELCQ